MHGDELWNQVDADLYEVLRLTPQATDTDIQRAWHHAARQAHPDTGGDTDRFHQVHIAYLVLSDPDARADYDRLTRHPRPAQQEEQQQTELLQPADLRTESSPLDMRMVVLLVVVVIASIAISYAWPWFTIMVGFGVGAFVLTRYFRHWQRRGSIL